MPIALPLRRAGVGAYPPYYIALRVSQMIGMSTKQGTCLGHASVISGRLSEEADTGIAVQTITSNDKVERILAAISEGDSDTVVVLLELFELVAPLEFHTGLLGELNDPLLQFAPANAKRTQT